MLHIEGTRPGDIRVAPKRGQRIGPALALDKSKAPLARRMHAIGEQVTTIAGTLGVSRATVYRVLTAEAGNSDTSP
jgi:DNA invertase Pin-like site-specific DNA recombinase